MISAQSSLQHDDGASIEQLGLHEVAFVIRDVGQQGEREGNIGMVRSFKSLADSEYALRSLFTLAVFPVDDELESFGVQLAGLLQLAVTVRGGSEFFNVDNVASRGQGFVL